MSKEDTLPGVNPLKPKTTSARPLHPVVPKKYTTPSSVQMNGGSASSTSPADDSQRDFAYHAKLRSYFSSSFNEEKARDVKKDGVIFANSSADADDDEHDAGGWTGWFGKTSSTQDEQTSLWKHLATAWMEKVYNSGTNGYLTSIYAGANSGLKAPTYTPIQHVLTGILYVLVISWVLVSLEWFAPFAILYVSAIVFIPVTTSEIIPNTGSAVHRIPLAFWFGSGIVTFLANGAFVMFLYASLHDILWSFVMIPVDIVLLVLMIRFVYNLKRSGNPVLIGVIAAVTAIIWMILSLVFMSRITFGGVVYAFSLLLFYFNVVVALYILATIFACSVLLKLVIPFLARGNADFSKIDYKSLVRPDCLSCIFGAPDIAYSSLKSRFTHYDSILAASGGVATITSEFDKVATPVMLNASKDEERSRAITNTIISMSRLFYWFLSPYMVNQFCSLYLPKKEVKEPITKTTRSLSSSVVMIREMQFAHECSLLWSTFKYSPSKLFISNVFYINLSPPYFNAETQTSQSSAISGYSIFIAAKKAESSYSNFKRALRRAAPKLEKEEAAVTASENGTATLLDE